MGKVTEKDITAFACEFALKVCEIDETLIDSDHVMHVGQKEFSLDFVLCFDITPEEAYKHTYAAEHHAREYGSDEEHECIAYLCIEGELYETLYNYEGYGYGGDTAEELWRAFVRLSDKYGMYYSWCGGAVAFYDAEDLK